MSFVNNVYNAGREKIERRVADLRYYRNTAQLQDAFIAAVEGFGVNRPLMLVASQSPELMALFDENSIPSFENLNVVGDKSVKLRDGLGEKTLKSAGLADWIEDTRDSLSDLSETANYHLAGIQKRLEENAYVIGNSGINGERPVNAPSFDDRNEDVNAVSRALEIVNGHWGVEDGTYNDRIAEELVRVTGICKMNDDYERTPEGMYCLERFAQGSLTSLGYDAHNLQHLLGKAIQMLAASRQLVSRSADMITAEYNETKDEEDQNTVSEPAEVSEEEPKEHEAPLNPEGRWDVEHPTEKNIEERENDIEAPMPHVPVKADPEEHELDEGASSESLTSYIDELTMVTASTEALMGQEGSLSTEELLNRRSDEDLTELMTKLGNKLTLIVCLIDCATHLGLHLLYISDEALKD